MEDNKNSEITIHKSTLLRPPTGNKRLQREEEEVEGHPSKNKKKEQQRQQHTWPHLSRDVIKYILSFYCFRYDMSQGIQTHFFLRRDSGGNGGPRSHLPQVAPPQKTLQLLFNKVPLLYWYGKFRDGTVDHLFSNVELVHLIIPTQNKKKKKEIATILLHILSHAEVIVIYKARVLETLLEYLKPGVLPSSPTTQKQESPFFHEKLFMNLKKIVYVHPLSYFPSSDIEINYRCLDKVVSYLDSVILGANDMDQQRYYTALLPYAPIFSKVYNLALRGRHGDPNSLYTSLHTIFPRLRSLALNHGSLRHLNWEQLCKNGLESLSVHGVIASQNDLDALLTSKNCTLTELSLHLMNRSLGDLSLSGMTRLKKLVVPVSLASTCTVKSSESLEQLYVNAALDHQGLSTLKQLKKLCFSCPNKEVMKTIEESLPHLKHLSVILYNEEHISHVFKYTSGIEYLDIVSHVGVRQILNKYDLQQDKLQHLKSLRIFVGGDEEETRQMVKEYENRFRGVRVIYHPSHQDYQKIWQMST